MHTFTTLALSLSTCFFAYSVHHSFKTKKQQFTASEDTNLQQDINVHIVLLPLMLLMLLCLLPFINASTNIILTSEEPSLSLSSVKNPVYLLVQRGRRSLH